jgi:hypothetical protein
MANPRLNQAVIQAVKLSPCTLRALARAGRVQPATLAKIGTGERRAPVAVAEAVAKALRQWARDCVRLAERIENALPEGRE